MNGVQAAINPAIGPAPANPPASEGGLWARIRKVYAAVRESFPLIANSDRCPDVKEAARRYGKFSTWFSEKTFSLASKHFTQQTSTDKKIQMLQAVSNLPPEDRAATISAMEKCTTEDTPIEIKLSLIYYLKNYIKKHGSEATLELIQNCDELREDDVSLAEDVLAAIAGDKEEKNPRTYVVQAAIALCAFSAKPTTNSEMQAMIQALEPLTDKQISTIILRHKELFSNKSTNSKITCIKNFSLIKDEYKRDQMIQCLTWDEMVCLRLAGINNPKDPTNIIFNLDRFVSAEEIKSVINMTYFLCSRLANQYVEITLWSLVKIPEPFRMYAFSQIILEFSNPQHGRSVNDPRTLTNILGRLTEFSKRWLEMIAQSNPDLLLSLFNHVHFSAEFSIRELNVLSLMDGNLRNHPVASEILRHLDWRLLSGLGTTAHIDWRGEERFKVIRFIAENVPPNEIGERMRRVTAYVRAREARLPPNYKQGGREFYTAREGEFIQTLLAIPLDENLPDLMVLPGENLQLLAAPAPAARPAPAPAAPRMNVHAGDRDQKMRSAFEQLRAHQGGLSEEETQTAIAEFTAYVTAFPDPDIREKALCALNTPRREWPIDEHGNLLTDEHGNPLPFKDEHGNLLTDEHGNLFSFKTENFGSFMNGDFTLLGLPTTGSEVIARLWRFMKDLSDPDPAIKQNDQDNIKNTMIRALADSFSPLPWLKFGERVCNQGKMQRLLLAIQGYPLAPGEPPIQIDDTKVRLNADQLVALFFSIQNNRTLSGDALRENAVQYCNNTPVIQQDERLKLDFMQKINTYIELQG